MLLGGCLACLVGWRTRGARETQIAGGTGAGPLFGQGRMVVGERCG